MTLMGGPVDAREAKTLLTEFSAAHPLDWFRDTVIHAIPFYYPGAYRMVYPGFLQLQGFMSMHMDRHVGEHFKMFQHLVRGDEEAAAHHRKFYDEYMSSMDVAAEYYLETIERVFQNHDLPRGTFRWRGREVKPEAIRRTALLTVEGEMDDISAPGQTRAAHNLCKSLPPPMNWRRAFRRFQWPQMAQQRPARGARFYPHPFAVCRVSLPICHSHGSGNPVSHVYATHESMARRRSPLDPRLHGDDTWFLRKIPRN